MIKFVVLFLLFSSSYFCQSLERQTISPYGTSGSDGNITIRQTIGQPYHTATNHTTGVSYRPGFQQPILSIEKISSSLSINVFPNPAFYYFDVKADKVLYDTKIVITDMSGKTIYENSLPELTTVQVDCALWAGGAYLITITNANEHFTGKLILQR